MNQQSPSKQQSPQTTIAQPEAGSPIKTDQEIKRQKKKKERALKDFLSKPQGDVIEVPKKVEEVEPERPPPIDQNCKICGQVGAKMKQCEFCKDMVCIDHVRKKRKFKNTNKFVRICDDCEDKYLFDKYRTSQSKAQQALAMQQMIVQAKRNELAQLAAGKQTKVQMLRNKKQELQEQKKEYENKIRIAQNDFANKSKKIENKLNENKIAEEEFQKLQDSLPRPLDDDYNCLFEQNNKLNRELVKYEKLCAEALKAKSIREKELYQAYNKWQVRQTNKAAIAKKKQECTIY